MERRAVLHNQLTQALAAGNNSGAMQIVGWIQCIEFMTTGKIDNYVSKLLGEHEESQRTDPYIREEEVRDA